MTHELTTVNQSRFDVIRKKIDLLPTSDVKPCTASVLKMAWSPQWSVRVKFVSYDQLNNDWRQALQDANDELNHQREGD